jgi:spore coat polysaccharide biosynthesis protein SpsF
MNKTGALIPLRLGSDRLPGAALREIQGKPAIFHLLDRAFASWYVESRNVVVCMSENPSDDALVSVVENYGANVFRGSADNIIDRLREAIQAFGFENVLQIDGEDILCETLYMDLVLERLLCDETADFVTCRNLPFGLAARGFSAEAMEKVYARYSAHDVIPEITACFTGMNISREAPIFPLVEDHVLDQARLTLDSEEDLEVLRQIFDALSRPNETFGIAEIIAFLREHPEIMDINGSLESSKPIRINPRS